MLALGPSEIIQNTDGRYKVFTVIQAGYTSSHIRLHYCRRGWKQAIS